MASSKRHSSLSLSSLITLFASNCYCCCCFIILLLVCGGGVQFSNASSIAYDVYATTVSWDHAVDLNEDFRILWTIINQDVTFEIQARTLGYVGIGFSHDGHPNGADMAIGWVDKGHTFFQDRYVKENGTPEPLVDPSQDYILIMGYENATHTVIRFRRKLDTCDSLHDFAITNNTMRIVYMYSDEDPIHGSVSPGSLPNVNEAWRPARSLVLTQISPMRLQQKERLHTLELRNHNVELPYGDDTLLWCKMFKLDEHKLKRKHHVVRFEPIYDSSWSIHYLRRITLYECQGSSVELEQMLRENGRLCVGGVRDISMACNTIAASWTRGSDGFSYPLEAGYPLDLNQAKFYLMESHYNNLDVDFDQFQAKRLTDNSGLRLYHTDDLRPNDAGVLSIGMDPNWRHIIPPGQKRVIAEGQCLEDCTGYALPSQGIHVFATQMRTHQIGREIKLRQIRKTEELPPISYDANIDSEYQETRLLSQFVHVLPGDRLVAECIYDSSSRNAITLGGLTMKEESCTVLTLYYPRQQKLTTCHSLPSLPTVLHSLGIQQLATNSNPVVISSPPELAGLTLEERLLSYDWAKQFNKFQRATLRGSFKPLCWGAHSESMPLLEHLTGFNVNLTKPYEESRRCKPSRMFVTETVPQLELPVFHDVQSNQIIEGSARSSRSSLIETLALSGSKSSARFLTNTLRHWHACILILIVFIS